MGTFLILVDLLQRTGTNFKVNGSNGDRSSVPLISLVMEAFGSLMHLVTCPGTYVQLQKWMNMTLG